MCDLGEIVNLAQFDHPTSEDNVITNTAVVVPTQQRVKSAERNQDQISLMTQISL